MVLEFCSYCNQGYLKPTEEVVLEGEVGSMINTSYIEVVYCDPVTIERWVSLSNANVITDESEELASKSKDSIVELFEDIKDIAT